MSIRSIARYGKQEALDRQLEYFSHDALVELNWMRYCARLKARSNWVKYAAHPFGDQVWFDKNGKPHHEFPLAKKFDQSDADHKLWADLRKGRSGFADPAHPFPHQGSADLNTYKMFLEAGYALFVDRWTLGLLVPSGIYPTKAQEHYVDCSSNEVSLEPSLCIPERALYLRRRPSLVQGRVRFRWRKVDNRELLRTRFRLGPGDSPEAMNSKHDIPNESGYCWCR